MGTGYSFHVGAARSGIMEPAVGADHTATLMKGLSEDRGFIPVGPAAGLLLDREATQSNVRSAFYEALRRLVPGDLLWASFSGHGKLLRKGDGDEPRNQCISFYDGVLIDDEIYQCLSKLAGGVRVLLVVDACYSGSIATAPLDFTKGDSWVHRVVAPRETSEFLRRPGGWRSLAATHPRAVKPRLAADVLLLASSDDRTISNASRSALTATPFGAALASVWRGCRNYVELRAAIWGQLRPDAGAIEPVLNDALASDAFVRETPMTP